MDSELHANERTEKDALLSSSGKLTKIYGSTDTPDKKSHTIISGWNVSNVIQGIGILGIPFATQQGGWAGVVINFLVALISCHTGKLIVECMYEKSDEDGTRRRVRVNYPEIGEAVFGPRGLILVYVVQNIEMVIAVVLYIITLGTGWTYLFRAITPALGLMEWAAISCAIILPMLFTKRFSIISWLGMISGFTLIAAILVLMVFAFTQIPSWNVSNIPAFDLQTFPVGFGIIVFSYCGHPVFPSVEESMTKPNQYNILMNIVFFIAAIIKFTLGIAFVLTFGHDTAQVATVNLAGHSVFGHLASSLIVANALLAIPLPMFLISQSFDNACLPYLPRMDSKSKFHWVWLLISRLLLIGLPSILAVTVPYFGLITGMIGSVTGTCLVFIFPCLFHLKLQWKALKTWQIVVDITIIVFGIIAGILGFVMSSKQLFLKLI